MELMLRLIVRLGGDSKQYFNQSTGSLHKERQAPRYFAASHNILSLCLILL